MNEVIFFLFCIYSCAIYKKSSYLKRKHKNFDKVDLIKVVDSSALFGHSTLTKKLTNVYQY